MSEWKEKSLEEIATFIDYRGKTPKKVESGVPLITAKIVKNGIIAQPSEFISKEDYPKWMIRGFPEVGDVVLTTEAPLGEVAQIKDSNVALAQRIITIRGIEEVLDNGYLKYFLQSHVGQSRLRARETGTTVTGIKSAELKKVLIPLPDLPTQKAIAEILSSLDDKIELNNKINQNLEQLAQTIFDNLIYTNRNREQVTVEHFVLFNPRLSIKKGTTTPFVEMKFLPTDGMNVTEVSVKPFTAGSKFKSKDTLLARITPCLENGKTAFVNFLSDKELGFGSTEFITMRANEFSCPEFVYCLSRNTDFRNHAISSMVGSSGRQRIQLDMLKAFEIPKIPNEEILNFKELSEPLFEQISHNRRETKNLIKLRDTLLPKLITGKLEISQTE